MLSILVPIYNFNAFPTVQELHRQCVEQEIPFEIICQDDASQSDLNRFNEKINDLYNCSFVSLKNNISHRENRNNLAAQSKFDWLLFLDGDSIITNKNYIHHYIKQINTFDIVYGGRLHPEKCPSNNQKLRWKYGRYMEDQSAPEREKKGYSALLFNNTVIKKKCFDTVKFDTNTTKYGHDDTQLSYRLNLKTFTLKHLENPVEHGDIDTNRDYIGKTKQSLENLQQLYQTKTIDPKFVKLLSLYDFLVRSKLKYGIAVFFKIFSEALEQNLKSNNPKLFFFNCFRLGYLCSISKQKLLL